MKKLKKLLAVLLAVAAVCALMVAPVSAISTNGSGQGQDYNWSSSLTLNGNSATARMVVSAKPSGTVPAFLCAEVEGIIFDSRGGHSVISNSSGYITGQTATAVGTAYISDAISATCGYYAQGAMVGSLKLP